jgi:LPS-assembly lipoprotein
MSGPANSRRSFLAIASRAGLATATTLGLCSCGFKLRRAPEFAFGSLFAGFTPGSPLGAEFARTLAQLGSVELVTDPKQMQRADAVLDVLSEQREKAVVGQGTVGQVREFQLRLRLRFRLRSAEGRELIGDTEMLQQREISFNESLALAKESEELLLYRDMQKEMVTQLMRRLAAVRKL